MIELESSSIDVIVTSPPYNRGKIYSSDENEMEYDDEKDLPQYLEFLTRVWIECFRVLKPTGTFFLNIGDSAEDQGKSEKVAQTAVSVGFIRLQTIVWVKSLLGRGHYTPTGGNRRLNNIWENIFVFVKDRRKYRYEPKAVGIPYADKSNIGRYSDSDLRDSGNAWLMTYSETTGATLKKGHDAPFPLELPLKCLKLAGAETVLDPFLGSGTTLAASKLLGIRGYGYEKFPRRDLIRKRISEPPTIQDIPPLIPHLEETAEFFLDFIDYAALSDSKFNDFVNMSKKNQQRFEIVLDTLKKLKLPSKLVSDLSWDHETGQLLERAAGRRSALRHNIKSRLTDFLSEKDEK